ncbi:MAG: hypothetical protein KJ944_00090 [Alphaproteobacteria bacterium]|nr:hypothetical protein [Alphaproteobacteria bacterium]MBU1561544.1 hypothetical protein [Alphaproteobacteria bacterium]MBU2300973.1 hypothetical protein [Alphaproteobacteria bacterium]MBU2367255.1 hypothetical protein [Alphaproteobacteria bacterium]
MTDPQDDLAALMEKLAQPGPLEGPYLRGVAARMRAPKPLYLLSVDDPDDRSVVLIVRAGRDGVQRATIALPEFHELPDGWDGPHEMHVAVPLADSYADAYGYHAIAIDIESSQLWDDAWGKLEGRDGL